MQRRISVLVLGLMVAVAACSKHDSRADTTLATDLSLAAQQKGNFQPLDSLSPTERAAGAAAYSGAATSRTSAPTRRTSTTSRSSGSTRTASSGTGTRSTSRTVVVKHPKRDAAIGAAAGAIIGAGTSRNKVKGAVVGAAVGGILGGIIGNNVDKSTKKVP